MSAISGLDIALWDLKGHRLGVPVWSLLGGKVRERIQVYVSYFLYSVHIVPTCVKDIYIKSWIGGDRPSDIENSAKARKDAGYKAVKVSESTLRIFELLLRLITYFCSVR